LQSLNEGYATTGYAKLMQIKVTHSRHCALPPLGALDDLS